MSIDQKPVDRTDDARDQINERTMRVELNRLTHFHNDINKRSSIAAPVMVAEAIRTLISRAASHMKTGETINFLLLMDEVSVKHPYVTEEAIRYITDVGVANLPKMQAYFLPTGVLGKWRRSTFTMSTAR